MSSTPLIKLTSGTKSFGDTHVLNGVDLEVNEGEVMAIIGPSGVGKSTLLRCLTLLEKFDDANLDYGDVKVCRSRDGQAKYADKQTLLQAKSNFGLVFQNFNLFPHWTVLENVYKPLQDVANLPKEEAMNKAKTILQRLDLSGKENFVPCDMSGGQQQRVAIARALAFSPSVLYFDEPTSALDPRLSREVSNLIRSVASEGIGTVVVTHEMNFARTCADFVAIMSSGKFAEVGRSSEVFENPQSPITREFLNMDEAGSLE